MPSDASSLSLTDWIVLALLGEADRHGFALAQELRAGSELGKVWTVHRPLVYRAIDHLEALGLVRRARIEPGRQGPERTLLRITRAGRSRLARWLTGPVQHPRLARSELLAKFVLLMRTGRDPGPLAEAQLERFAPLLAGLDASAAEATGTDRIVAAWRLESMRATQRFLERVRDGAFEPTVAPAGRSSPGSAPASSDR